MKNGPAAIKTDRQKDGQTENWKDRQVHIQKDGQK